MIVPVKAVKRMKIRNVLRTMNPKVIVSVVFAFVLMKHDPL